MNEDEKCQDCGENILNHDCAFFAFKDFFNEKGFCLECKNVLNKDTEKIFCNNCRNKIDTNFKKNVHKSIDKRVKVIENKTSKYTLKYKDNIYGCNSFKEMSDITGLSIMCLNRFYKGQNTYRKNLPYLKNLQISLNK